PTLVRSILCGLVLAMCCLTKQIVAGFLIFPGLFFLIAALMDKDKLFRIKGTITVAVSTILFALPWLIANWGEMMKMESTVKVEFAEAGMSSSLFGNLFYYAGSLWWSLSPSLCLLFVASILLVGPKKHLRLLPIWASSLGGLLFISSWTFRLPDERYLVPGLLIAAVCSSVLVGQLLHQTRLFPKLCVLFLLLAGICSNYVQFFDRSFVDRFAPVRVFAGLPSGNGQAPDLSPVRFSDWGYSWVFSSIEKIDGQQPVYLNVLTNLPELNAHTFELEVKERNLGLRPTTSRVYTCGGDQVEFNRETALYYEWYLIKTGNQGYRLKDKKDVKNLSLLEGFIASGGEYYLVGSRTAPDGAILKLYRKIIM
ncbi:MAG: hypothetical protein K8F91_03390, partial [Candidatus Obscuribacterales bacterium]|nr:hypothetical protein [Candidatus Obscuribacterales bacterium]